MKALFGGGLLTTAEIFCGNTYQWVFRVCDGGTQTINVQKTTTITASTWHHIALVRNGNNFMIFEALH